MGLTKLRLVKAFRNRATSTTHSSVGSKLKPIEGLRPAKLYLSAKIQEMRVYSIPQNLNQI